MSLASRPGEDAAPPNGRVDAAFAAACAAITFLVFLPALHGDFLLTWDDDAYVVLNHGIRTLTPATVAGAFTDLGSYTWTPLTELSFALDYRLWGLDPFGFHLTNVVLHAVNAGFGFLVALRVLALPAISFPGTRARWAAALAALAWALHPLRVESVAWVSERKDVLSLFFGLAAILAYLAHVRSGEPFARSPRYALALALYALSLLAKPALVTLPVVLAILDAWPLRRPGRGRSWPELAEKLPWLAAAALSTALTLTGHADAAMPLADAGVVSRILVALRAVFEYVRMSLWPAGLSPFYLHPGNVSPGDLSHLVPAALVVGITVASIRLARRHPAIAAAWLCWLTAAAPGLGATQVADAAMADRYTYFATMPLTLLVAGGAATGLARLARGPAVAGAVGVAAAVALLAALSVRQISFWRDDVALWSRPIALDPARSGRVYSERSTARARRGDWAGARTDMDAAIAIAASRDYAFMHSLYWRRARILVRLGARDDAEGDYGRALQTAPPHDAVVLLRERASVYRSAGKEELAAADEQLAARLASAP